MKAYLLYTREKPTGRWYVNPGSIANTPEACALMVFISLNVYNLRAKAGTAKIRECRVTPI